MKIRTGGAYIIKSAEGRPQRVPAKQPPPGYVPPQPTDADRALARALLAVKRPTTSAPPEQDGRDA